MRPSSTNPLGQTTNKYNTKVMIYNHLHFTIEFDSSLVPCKHMQDDSVQSTGLKAMIQNGSQDLFSITFAPMFPNEGDAEGAISVFRWVHIYCQVPNEFASLLQCDDHV